MTMTYARTTALITGASSGLGSEFAARFAARGANLVLIARRTERLEDLARKLRTAHGISVTTLSKDLSRPGAGAEVRDELAVSGVRIDTLINNAGFATSGPLVEEDPAVIASEISLNVASLVETTRAFLPEMLAAGNGALINVASTAAFQPVPGMAVYGATKAFVLSFTEALAYETRESGLRVLALCPGATRTEFFDVLGSQTAAVGRLQTASAVIDTALRALDRRATPASVVSGLGNRMLAGMAQRLPRHFSLAMAGRAVQE